MEIVGDQMGVGFDLNIEKILEHWEPRHAVREIIANALDEQLLTETGDIEISKEGDEVWQVRDFGRGLAKEHLTQAENPEKLANPRCIGKFGIGLKDALATLNRRGVKVTIESRHGLMSLAVAPKHGFEDIQTLHVFLEPPRDTNFVGTRFKLECLPDAEVAAARELFLRFSGDQVLEENRVGAILARGDGAARIYVNGVRIAEEERFLFGYDVRSLTKPLRKALNRERSNVGRAAYQDRVKAILLDSKTPEVARKLADDLRGYADGNSHDELSWVDVQEHAVRILAASQRTLFLTADQMAREPATVDEARTAGIEIVPIPTTLADRVRDLRDIAGNPIRGLDQFHVELAESFQYKFVQPKDLRPNERRVYARTRAIFDLAGGKPSSVREVAISETMRRDPSSFQDAEGVWDPSARRIIVKRSQLRDLASYSGTLLHEAAHARRGAPDLDRTFETELSRLLGRVVQKSLSS
ncbi:MAG: ATP-binding protein [Thermoplasmata archaeon]